MTLPSRWPALDNLRGLAVLVMLPINAAMTFTAIPDWFKHATADGVTLADFVLPVFLFSLGVSAAFSLPRQWAEGRLKTVGRALARNATLFAFGTIGFVLVYGGRNWEVLQTLGLTGLVALPFLLAPVWARAVAAAGLLAVTEWARPVLFGPEFLAWYESGLGGPWGAVPLAALVLAASALGDWLRFAAARLRVFVPLAVGAASVVLAAALSLWQPWSKHLLTASYLLLTGGTAAMLLGAAGTVDRPWPLVSSLGRNPLLAYLVGGVLTLLVRAFVPADVGSPWAWTASLGVLAAVAAGAAVLDRRGVYVRL